MDSGLYVVETLHEPYGQQCDCHCPSCGMDRQCVWRVGAGHVPSAISCPERDKKRTHIRPLIVGDNLEKFKIVKQNNDEREIEQKRAKITPGM